MLVNDAEHTSQQEAKWSIVIKPTRGWRTLNLSELWAYRDLLWVLTVRDIKIRYKQTVLGVAWAVLQPLLMMMAFSVFFGRLARIPSDGLPYPLFVFAALLPWVFFSSALSSAAGSAISSTNLISKVYFPRLIIPLASVGSWLLDFLIAGAILLMLMVWYHITWTWNLLAIPMLLVGVMLASVGVGTLLCALTVAYRDFKYVVPFLLQFWMIATPIAYPASLVPQTWRWALELNPLAGLIGGFRSAFLGLPFDLPALEISLFSVMVFFVVGLAYFERVERRFADII